MVVSLKIVPWSAGRGMSYTGHRYPYWGSLHVFLMIQGLGNCVESKKLHLYQTFTVHWFRNSSSIAYHRGSNQQVCEVFSPTAEDPLFVDVEIRDTNVTDWGWRFAWFAFIKRMLALAAALRYSEFMQWQLFRLNNLKRSKTISCIW